MVHRADPCSSLSVVDHEKGMRALDMHKKLKNPDY
jgi:hypothetical protein